MSKQVFRRKCVILTFLSFCLFVKSGLAQASNFEVTSPVLKPGGTVPKQQLLDTCGGENISPPLRWFSSTQNSKGSPLGVSKGFAVSMFDLDAPTGKGWWHWLLVNLPASTRELPAGAGTDTGNFPAQCRNDYGQIGYGGPCPPQGAQHRYVITVYALNVAKLSIKAGDSARKAFADVKSHAIGVASMTVVYRSEN
ncbi:MAG: YbhB/YbcL family Raf kinase inhibitor-like protein [Verrucomicrobia bacterium]|nr:YbhB/YbcL family Raf kinase inhibitor-like protein [Verrucomicrobiota bacterium]